MARSWNGPEPRPGPGRKELAPGVWITSGRAAVLEGGDHLAVVDPGDEPAGTAAAPLGPLADVLALAGQTGKPVRWILLTHGHPDHVANLAVFRKALGPGLRVAAHPGGPVDPDEPVGEARRLPAGPGLLALPTPGHSPRGDDLAFWVEARRVLFSGDLVQPKGETWARAFFPSPWVCFRDGDTYRRSLDSLLALPFLTLVTGHREVRSGREARRWVELTRAAIDRVAAAVTAWDGPEDLVAAGEAIFRKLAAERGIPPDLVRRRLSPGPDGVSAFTRFDLPGVAYFWERRPPRPPDSGTL